ncbi:hypothetical protein AGMMS49965_19980 [Bacteroidia bacterium]|nr:hypothetical protein AGMMS49965_19980 [Bacteroidia bacterium]
MNGGTITDCYAVSGGGVYTAGYFEMNDGSISGDSAKWGGGVCVEGETFAMKGGTISTNKAKYSVPDADGGLGGGVYLMPYGNFVMSGGTIYGVKAFDSNDAESDVDSKNIAEISGSSLFIEPLPPPAMAPATAKYSGVTTPTGIGISDGDIITPITPGYNFTHHTLPSTINEPDPFWYVYEGGNDAADGRSVETAKAKPQEAVNSIGAWHAAHPYPSIAEATILVYDTIRATGGNTLVNISSIVNTYPPITLRGAASDDEWPNFKVGVLNANDIPGSYVLNVYEQQVTLGANLTLMGGNSAAPGLFAGGAAVGGSSGNLILLDGAFIIDNKGYLGGGVYVWWEGTFTMKGGTITENTSIHGGGVYVDAGGIFNMTAGFIGGGNAPTKGTTMGNEVDAADGYGGGVYVHHLPSKGTFKKTGGTIYGWSATPPDPPIDNNRAKMGQGAAVWDYTHTGSEATDDTLGPGDDYHSTP